MSEDGNGHRYILYTYIHVYVMHISFMLNLRATMRSPESEGEPGGSTLSQTAVIVCRKPVGSDICSAFYKAKGMKDRVRFR